jgi:mannose-6-phosphate isomerase
MYRIENTIRDYAWGSPTAIPKLFRRAPTGQPQAELWIGAHPGAPSRVVAEGVGLDELLDSHPELLGGQAKLPFLMKVLAAAEPLSLQVHPTIAQAEQGFAAEERSGLARDAATRNYKDGNHKPELLVALDDFSALCGFRPPAQAAEDLRSVLAETSSPPAFGHQLLKLLENPDEQAALHDSFEAILTGGEAAGAFALCLVDWAKSGRHSVGRTISYVAESNPADPSITAILLINRIDLLPSDAIYLDAGTIHAYLYGTGIEAMASSDNVLRGGLTPKHIDIPELLKVLRFEATVPGLVPPESSSRPGVEITSYRPPIAEFAVHDLRVDTQQPSSVDWLSGPAVVLNLAGEVSANGETLALGEAGFMPAGQTLELTGTGRIVATTQGVVR